MPGAGRNARRSWWRYRDPSGPAAGRRGLRRVVVGVTGATGATYAVRLLARLRETGVESHLVAPAGLFPTREERRELVGTGTGTGEGS